MSDDLSTLMAEQLAYYRRGATEYDEANRVLRVADDDDGRSRRHGHGRAVEVLATVAAGRDVVELAGGTGIYTSVLAAHAAALTVVDASPESIAINRAATAGAPVDIDFRVGDVFSWRPPRRYEVVVFAFWLSHVPKTLFAEFWRVVDGALVDGGTVVVVDAQQTDIRPVDGNFFSEQRLDDDLSIRSLSDGSRFRIVRVLWDQEDLTRRLDDEGWRITVDNGAAPWLVATVRRATDQPGPRQLGEPAT